MKPGVIAAIVVAVLVAVGAVFFIMSGDDSTTTESTTTQTPITTANETSMPAPDQEQSQDQLIKPEEVAMHATEDDCWTIIDGMVYDITSYIPRHPGGSTILAACGGDGSTLFNERTTEDGETVGSGTPHSSNASSQLASLKIGVLDTTIE